MRIGILLGRFQPLHPGHLFLIDRILEENDKMIVCIGSAQKAEPFTIEERHSLIEKQLRSLYNTARFAIVELVDPEPIETWPEALKEICGIDDRGEKTFYRADPLPQSNIQRLGALGFKVKLVGRFTFYYRAPDGLYYRVSSATEIKKIHQKLEVSLKSEGGKKDA